MTQSRWDSTQTCTSATARLVSGSSRLLSHRREHYRGHGELLEMQRRMSTTRRRKMIYK